MRSICVSAVAIVVLSLGPLLAADSASLKSFPHPAAVSKSETLGFFATMVTAGFQDYAVPLPCFNCVAGASVVTVGLAAPLGAVDSGTALTISLSGDNLSYDGQASFQYNLVSGGTTVMTGSVAAPVTPGIWLAQFPINAPAPGRYLLQGIIWTGANLTTKTVIISQLMVF